MVLTGGNRSNRRKGCQSEFLFTKNTTWDGSGKNTGFRGRRPASNCLRYGIDLKVKFNLNYI